VDIFHSCRDRQGAHRGGAALVPVVQGACLATLGLGEVAAADEGLGEAEVLEELAGALHVPLAHPEGCSDRLVGRGDASSGTSVGCGGVVAGDAQEGAGGDLAGAAVFFTLGGGQDEGDAGEPVVGAIPGAHACVEAGGGRQRPGAHARLRNGSLGWPIPVRTAVARAR
jgi:hypothetical protein